MKNTIRWIYFADCLQCVKNEYHVEDYIHGDEFVVLTNPDVTEDKNKLMALITSMVDYGIAALGINEDRFCRSLSRTVIKKNFHFLNCQRNSRLWICHRYCVKGCT